MKVTNRIFILCTWTIGIGLSLATDAHAQAPPALEPPPAMITTDTGIFAPGRQDFSRYDTPKLCLAAARGTLNIARRSLEAQFARDTLQNAQYDTIGIAAAKGVARACTFRFLAPGTSMPDLATLFATAILLTDDTLALRVLEYQLTQVPTLGQQSALRLSALTSFLGLDGTSDTWNRSDPRLSRAPLQRAADSMIARLDRDTSFLTRLQMRQLVLQYWEGRDSVQAIQQAANDVLDLMLQAPPNALDSTNVKSIRVMAYADLMAIAFFFHGIDSLTAVAERAQREKVQLPFGSGWPTTKEAGAFSVHEIITKLSPIDERWDPQARPLVSQLDAAFWYPSNESHVFPVPGVVTVVAVGGGIEMAIRVRRWLSHYSRNDLRVVMLDRTDDTAAFWWDPSDSRAMNGPMTASERAEQSRWYYQDYLQLPVTVAVQLHKVTFGPWPKERRTSLPPAHPEKFMGDVDRLDPGDVAVITRDGRLVYSDRNVLSGRLWYHMPVDKIIAWAVAQHVSPHAATAP